MQAVLLSIFIGKATEAQRDKVTCSRQQSQQVVELGSEPRSSVPGGGEWFWSSALRVGMWEKAGGPLAQGGEWAGA